MFIAFEGPDKVGKTTTANELSFDGVAIYNMTKANHSHANSWMWHPSTEIDAENTTITFDRIDWLTHMVYRLALPGYEWNDERVRTVFAAPDTHLVFKLHRASNFRTDEITDELYEDGQLEKVNDTYHDVAAFLTILNENSNYSLFKSVTIIEVERDVTEGLYSQRIIGHSRPGTIRGIDTNKVITDEELVALLKEAE